MNQRSERLAGEIQAALGEIIARGEIRDPRVRDAGIVTITRVRVTGDLSEARVAFTVFGADEGALDKVNRGLEAARSFLQQALARRLRTRKTAMLSFEIDRALDHAFRVDGLLRGVAAESALAAAAAAADSPPESTLTDPPDGPASPGALPPDSTRKDDRTKG
jgi:ribosome-binding factor A